MLFSTHKVSKSLTVVIIFLCLKRKNEKGVRQSGWSLCSPAGARASCIPQGMLLAIQTTKKH